MEETKEISKTESLATEVLNRYFFIEPDTRPLKDATDVFPAGMTFVRLSDGEIQAIRNKKEVSAPKTYMEFARVPAETHVEDVHKEFLNNPEELLLNYHEIVAFCEKYKEWFKNHIRIGYFFTTEGFVLVRDPHRTGKLSITFYKMAELHDLGVGLKNSLAFIIKVDWGKFIPH